jgi:hypothetical protein
MTDNLNIDELLNGFIDGELSAREQVEVQRLIAHDEGVTARLRELQRCKVLVGSLPCAEAPAGTAEQIKASLGRIAPIVQPALRIENVGARHLLLRKVAAVAAMVGLVAVLAAVIYTIVGSDVGTERPVAVKDWERPVGELKTVKPEVRIAAVTEKPVLKPAPAEMEFVGRLELETSEPAIVEASINRAIEDNGLSEKISAKSEGNKRLYALDCSREALRLLLTDLGNIWKRLDSATLIVETDRFGEQVVVEAVGSGQVIEIVEQDSPEARIGVAKDFAVLNRMAGLSPGREMFAAIDDAQADLTSIPKPVLTSGEKSIKEQESQPTDDQKAHLTIVLLARR